MPAKKAAKKAVKKAPSRTKKAAPKAKKPAAKKKPGPVVTTPGESVAAIDDHMRSRVGSVDPWPVVCIFEGWYDNVRFSAGERARTLLQIAVESAEDARLLPLLTEKDIMLEITVRRKM